MSTWPDTRILDLLGIDVPIIQAPMAGATTAAMVIAANNAGALGSMPAAALSIEQLREALSAVRLVLQVAAGLNKSTRSVMMPSVFRAIRRSAAHSSLTV